MTTEPPKGRTSGGRSDVLRDFLIFLGLVLVGLVIAAIALPVLSFVLAVGLALAKLLVLALLVYLIVYWISPETAAKWREKVRRVFR